jgi:hypothetical protein
LALDVAAIRAAQLGLKAAVVKLERAAFIWPHSLSF